MLPNDQDATANGQAATAGSPAPTAAPRRSRRVQAVEHAIDVLQVLATSGQGVGTGAIANKVNLSKATVHHLLETLEAKRFVVRDRDRAQYRLGWGLYELGSAVVRSVDIARVARYHLDSLAAQTEEATLLGILDEDAVLYLDRGDAPRGFQMVAGAGRRSPLHSTASGKVLLAFTQDYELVQRILRTKQPQMTETTITDPMKLRYELALVRQRGFATCWQEREVGLSSVAVPIRDYTNSVTASLAIAAPATRLNTRTVQANLAPLLSAARRIGSELGHGYRDAPELGHGYREPSGE